jgi:uncharacterized Tic20 family protein
MNMLDLIIGLVITTTALLGPVAWMVWRDQSTTS